jgi:hypothetical protein
VWVDRPSGVGPEVVADEIVDVVVAGRGRRWQAESNAVAERVASVAKVQGPVAGGDDAA